MFDPIGTVLAFPKAIVLAKVTPLPEYTELLSAIVAGPEHFFGLVSSYDEPSGLAEVDIVLNYSESETPDYRIFRVSALIDDPWDDLDDEVLESFNPAIML